MMNHKEKTVMSSKLLKCNSSVELNKRKNGRLPGTQIHKTSTFKFAGHSSSVDLVEFFHHPFQFRAGIGECGLYDSNPLQA